MDQPSPPAVLISCEHASNAVPAAWSERFVGADPVLASHQGWDPGAAELARELAVALDARLLMGQWTRLLADTNRSPHNPARFSAYTRDLDAQSQEILDREIITPYQKQGQAWIARRLGEGNRVLHLSVHSFTPVMGGVVRRTDIGVLHVSRRAPEIALAHRWQCLLQQALPELVVDLNQPYAGDDDGYVPWLHSQFPVGDYCGIELEINQRFPLAGGKPWLRVRRAVVGTFSQLAACRN